MDKYWDPIDVAYIAGIIDGEGHIQKHDKAGWAVRVSMCDGDVVQRLYDMTGIGNIHIYPPRGNQQQDVWTWSVQAKKDVYRLLAAVSIFLGDRKQAEAIKVCDVILESSFSYCSYCATRFYKTRGSQKFCDDACRIADKGSKVKGTEGPCSYCGQFFIRSNSGHRFCNPTCRDAWNWRNMSEDRKERRKVSKRKGGEVDGVCT